MMRVAQHSNACGTYSAAGAHEGHGAVVQVHEGGRPSCTRLVAPAPQPCRKARRVPKALVRDENGSFL